METKTTDLAPRDHYPRLFGSELFLISGRRRCELLALLRKLEKHLEGPDRASLQEIAFTLSRGYEKGVECLSIVASSHEDLQRKLAYARKRLEDDDSARINEKSGIYYSSQRLGDRKLVFLFPGENAQYVNMLADLCLHFPEVRGAFDEVDAACLGSGDGFLPSALVFPPTCAEGSREKMGEMAKWEKAIALVHTANTAMTRLLDRLEVRPDAVVGHSFGELAALEVAGVLRPGKGPERVDFLREAYLHIKDLATNKSLPAGALLTVGGVDGSRIADVISRYPGTLCVAMENCPHQYVLCASGKDMDSVIRAAAERLTKEGAICSRLPINRPYHTDFFKPAFRMQRAFLERIGVHPPQIEIHSCSSTGPFPEDPEGILDLAARYWMTPVKFQRTIENLYEQGFRIFLDVGPRGNLCAFVNDILRGREHLALAANRAHRSGVVQLLHSLGQLVAHGTPLRLDYLHNRWGSRMVDLDGAGRRSGRNESHLVQLPTFLPQMRVDGVGKGRVAAAAGESPARGEEANIPRPPRQAVMMAYLDTMDQFLAAQREIVGRLVENSGSGRKREGRSIPHAVPPSPSQDHALPRLPLLGKIVERVRGESLVAVRTYDTAEDLYLRDHSLGTVISATDPELGALPVMPLVMSLEIVAEAGSALFPDKKVVAVINVRANRWILFEEGRIRLRILASVLARHGKEMHVLVSLKEEDEQEPRSGFRPSLIEATAVLADEYPPPPAIKVLPLSQPMACNWTGKEIYPLRTFHGPLLQGIRAIERVARDGLDGRIEVLPRTGLIRSDPDPGFVFDPLLVDCMGQAVWLWDSKKPFLGRAYLPYQIGALRFYGPKLPPGVPLALQLRVSGREGMTVATDLKCMDETGRIQVTIEKLLDREFELSPAFHRVIMQPIEGMLSEVRDLSPLPGLPEDSRLSIGLIRGFPTSILEAGYGVWRKALAFLILNLEERGEWKGLKFPLGREIQWLLGRDAVKDVVRYHLLKHTGQELAAADVWIKSDARNKPFVAGGWKTDLRLIPPISITHAEGMIAAVCGDAEVDFSIGIDTEVIREMDGDFLDGGFSPEELALVPPGANGRGRWEGILRLWCAKEAVGKALGSGVPTDPHRLRVVAFDPDTGRVTLRWQGPSAGGIRLGAGDQLIAATFREHDHALAVSVLTQKERR